jgi:hypothetical protein
MAKAKKQRRESTDSWGSGLWGSASDVDKNNTSVGDDRV